MYGKILGAILLLEAYPEYRNKNCEKYWDLFFSFSILGVI
jgi:hypothetical protein